MSIHPLPPPKAPTGLGRLPVARWFVLLGVLAGVTFAAGVVIIMTMSTQAEALHPPPALAAQLDRLNAALIAVFALLVALGVGLAFMVRYAVLKPIDQLTAQVRTVAGGDFDHDLHVDRPAELAELSSHIDSMRARIVSAWRVATDQAEELRRSNGELEQFAYVASHDLQEPLRKVASFTQMLEQRYGPELDERARQYIHYAVDGAKRMQLLINDLLDFSRVGRVTGEKSDIDSGAALDRALENLSATVEDAGATVTRDELPRLRANELQLTQLFQNLIENAVKFRSEAPPRVHIGVRRDGEMWEFSCADNGIGVEPKYADRIFLIFQRLHARDVYPGTGIGLALCRKIVEYHGGQLWLDGDSDGHGATFRWTLPAAGGE
ncbi:sensor histidine kinase [Nonomuraea gerenzanensis]|uniref:histidine kinase n=1 Tax=Nonomuraea gerenzanensis TaxID=93944 RepID=A0A1M4EPQ3_9ACTN|nr:ATP-binding protein [Nonomuraea gerenzanensis]UBU12303.1 HAMP domain-containing protein [Nonomuraea gerenzanensis]SBP00842.1 Phytochrome, two-component sensor histidine kinase; cyanobacterial phytochrome 1 [Nonomuraea gerenzanensis]